MSSSNRIIALGIRKLWTLIAVLLVLVALFISLLRYSLPLLDDRKHVIEDYVATQYGLDLSIGSVSATWQSSGPSLQLSDVHLRQGEQSPVALKVGDVYLSVKFWSSVFSGKLQSRNVNLSDLHLLLDLQRIEGGTTDFPILQALESIFLEQLSNFSVTNSEITLVNNANQNTIRIRQLSWLNIGNRHQGLGELSLQGFASNTASFVLDLEGDVDSYDGTLYAKGTDLDISPWINEFTNLDSNLVTSKGNIAVWAQIDQGQFTDIRGEVQPSQFDWRTRDTEQQINTQVSASFAAALDDDQSSQWRFAIKDFSVQTNNESFNSEWLGTFSPALGVSLHNKKPLNLSSLLPLSALVFAADSPLNESHPSVEMPKLFVNLTQQKLQVVANDTRLSWHQVGDIPGIEQLYVDSYWSGQHGLVRLRSKDTALEAQSLFDRALALEQLDIPINIKVTDTTWSLSSTRGQVLVDGINMRPNLSYASESGTLSIMADIGALPLKQVPSLLPNQYMGDDVKSYLSDAFVGEGSVKHAHILWHGKPSNFPFDDFSGTFQAAVAIENADFVFSDAWPELSNLSIDLLFENESLYMTADSGVLAGVDLSNLRAEIPSLTNNSMLTILTDGTSDGAAVAKLMRQSSLKDSLGRVLSQDVVVSGPVSTKLGLYIPLSKPDDTRAVGEAILSNSDVRIAALDLDFTKATGVIAFDNETLSIDGIDAVLLDQSVSIALGSEQSEDAYDLDIDIVGAWDIAPILDMHASKLNDYLSGGVDWQLSLDVSLQGEDYYYTAELDSELLRLGSELPFPLQKHADSVLDLSVKANGNNMASTVELKLGSDVTFEGVLPHKEGQFSRAHLALGQTDFVGMGVGFSISANLPSIDTEKWIASVSALVGGLEDSGSAILSVPERIFAQADQLLVSGTRVTDVNLTAKRLDRDWRIEVDADQVRGTMDISDDWVSKGVRIDADYVKLNDVDFSLDATKTERSIVPQSLPLIDFSCESCEIANTKLGRINLQAQPNDDGLEITRVQMQTDNGTINASGQWYKRHEDHYTFLAGDLRSAEFGRLLSDFGLDSGIKDSQANIDFAVTWKDSPMDFGFEQLDGQIDWALTDGYLTEVSDKGSRIFTLLSLNSLVRKLSLDFRDVFAKGFFYDDMNGSIQITDGKADTRDTAIDGAAGDIEIYGYTDLVSKELNYNVSFTPNVTGNLPVLVYFFTVSPPSALAALAIDQVLTSTKVISNVNYSVSGTIDDPVLIETGRESTEVELPTRRNVEPDTIEGDFLPPTIDDLLPMEQGGG
ncbi:YhdP family protein [Glaciecola siphonariae]|uniref:YhdP family protein n=1 Tax=Glaciecola siphonariae TaxID=521012 RepID=A0ABV9LWW7_9ALTE